MTGLLLVRHAEPLVLEGTPPARWPLSDQGRHQAQALGRRLDPGATTGIVYTSPARRARATAALAFPSAAVVVRPELREVGRAWYGEPGQLADAVGRYLAGEVLEGWEPLDDVRARLASLEAGVDLECAGPAVVVSHGVLLTAWLHQRRLLEDPSGFWSQLRLPDAWAVGPGARGLERVAP